MTPAIGSTTTKALGGFLLYGSVLFGFAFLIVYPFIHALRRGRWPWMIIIACTLHAGGFSYWIWNRFAGRGRV